MKEDVGMSKHKKLANNVGRLTQVPKLNKPLPYNPTQVLTRYKAKYKDHYGVIWKLFV